MVNNKNELVGLWKKIFNQVYETSSYAELFACSYLCRSHNHLNKEIAERNLEILKKHNGFFVPFEHGMAYAVVLSLTKLLEGEKQLSLHYLVCEAEKFKINKNREFNELKKKHQDTIDKLKIARDNFFAHRHKNFEKIDIPSRDTLFNLLNDTASFLNSIGSELEDSHSYLWNEENEGFAEETRRDFQLVLDNLYRGESARIKEIELKYSAKLHTLTK